jgi:hypothetical protein
MTTSKALSGFTPSRRYGSRPNSTGTDSQYVISSGYASNIFAGDLVRVSAGNLNVIATTTEYVWGVFQGCYYETDGEPRWSRYWPASTSASNAYGIISDDPQTVYEIQADASISAGDIRSQNFDVTLGAGSTVTGNSGFGIAAGTRNPAQRMTRVVGWVDEPGNNIDVSAERAFEVVEVKLIQHIDRFGSIGVSARAS